MKKMFQLIETYSLPLLTGILLALLWANLAPHSYHALAEAKIPFFDFTVHFAVKEIFMTFFFAVAMVEVVEAVLPGGAMSPLKKAINPLLATVGGVVGPILVFLVLATVCDGQAYLKGWGIVTATDIAVAWLGAKLIFGSDHPAVKYLLLLAVADDAVGLLIIGIFYPTAPIRISYLILCLLGMGIAWLLRHMHTEHYGFYLVLGGAPAWLGLHLANVEPALALVLIVPFLPSVHRRDLLVDAGMITPDVKKMPLEQFYYHWHPLTTYGLFFFGLVSAGVEFSSLNTVTYLIVIALLLGKLGGIFLCGSLSHRLGFSLPEGMGRRDLLIIAAVAGVGLTVSLFICESAFVAPEVSGAAKMGALFSIAALPLAYILNIIVRKKPNGK